MQNDRTHVFGWLFFALVGVVALVLGVLQTLQGIRKPFEPDPAALARVRAALDKDIVDPTKDTDEDGLTDYDEQTRYKTSAYIKDTDSDGIDDAKEVQAGTNPNCPEGKDCTFAITAPTAPLELGVEPPPPAAGTVSLEPDAATLREALLQAGLPKESLDQIDDAELLRLYRETVAESQNTNSITTNP